MDVPKTLDHASIEEQDLVSRYVGDKLSPEEAEAFEEHYFGCDVCWSEVQQATELRAALREPGARPIPSPVVRGPWRSWSALAAAAGIAIAVALGLFLASRRTGIDSLARAAGEAPSRSVEGRLTGPFRYRPRAPVMRGAEDSPLALDLRRAALEAQKRAQEHPSADTLRVSALGHLLTGEADEAISQLEEAKKRNAEDVAILNDLAAAYLTRAFQRSGREEGSGAAADFDVALGTVSAALERNPKSPEARFNKALILEAQRLRKEAADAWRAYLEVDSSSPWAAEARRHLERLSEATDSELWERFRETLDGTGATPQDSIERLARRFPQQIRLHVQDELLPAWGRARLAGDRAPADSALEVARRAARALQAFSGDSSLADSVAAIDAATTDVATARLARGHQLYGVAREDYKRLAIPSAASSFEESRALLADVGSPFHAHAILGRVTCLLYQNTLRPGLEVIDRLIESEAPASNRHLSILAQAHWYRGFIRGLMGYPHEALEEDGRALALFERLGEKESSAAIEGLLSEDFASIGDEDRSFTHLDRALALLDDVGEIPRRAVWLASASRAHSAAGHDDLAALFQGRLVAEAESTGKPDTIADALLSSAITHYRGGRTQRAEDELRRARQVLRAIPDADVRRRVEANLDLSEITLASRGDSPGDIQRLTDALAFFETTGNHLGEARLYLERGRMYVRREDPIAARADFEKGIDELEKHRADLADQTARIQYFDTGRRLLESEVALLAANRDAESSFLYADRSHARALLDDLRTIPGRNGSPTDTRTAEPLVLRDLTELASDGTAIVEFLMLPEEVVIWVARRGGVEIVRTVVAEDRVRSLVQQLEGAEADSRPTRPALAELHDILIAPAAALIAETPHLVFIPDRDLNRVPFSALWDGRTNGYLIEKHDITIAPSAAALLHLRGRAPPAVSEPSVLVVAGPPSAPLPGLRRLERLDEECRQVSSVYPRSLVLRGDRATPNSFRELAAAYPVIHFAGHAVANLTRPALSMLVLSPDAASGAPGYLYSHELLSIDFDGVALVVLGACSTAAGRESPSEGVLGLARSILAAGVPSVAASLWPVEDATTERLMTAFHAELRAGKPTAGALRAAQLKVLKADKPTELSWSAFQIYGVSVVIATERSTT